MRNHNLGRIACSDAGGRLGGTRNQKGAAAEFRGLRRLHGNSLVCGSTNFVACRVACLKRRGAFKVRASVLDCGSPLFPLPTSFQSACAGRLGPTARPHTSLGQRPRTFGVERSALKARSMPSEAMERAFSANALRSRDLGRCPTAIKLSLEALVTRARSQAPAWECSIPGGSSLLPDLQKHSAPERNGRLEPPRQARSQAGAWERDREFLNLMAVGRCPRLVWCRAVGAETRLQA